MEKTIIERTGDKYHLSQAPFYVKCLGVNTFEVIDEKSTESIIYAD